MKISILVLIFLLSSCTSKQIKPSVTTPENVPPVSSPSATPSIDPPRGGVTFEPVEYYTTKTERELIDKASIIANRVRSSDCTFDFISKRKMIQTQGKTNVAVATEVRALTGVVPVEFYYERFSGARAYRSPPGKTIYLNRKYIGPNSDICDVAGTLNHESLHALAEYDHDHEWSPEREYSVPYSYDHAFASEPYSMSDSGGCCK